MHQKIYRKLIGTTNTQPLDRYKMATLHYYTIINILDNQIQIAKDVNITIIMK